MNWQFGLLSGLGCCFLMFLLFEELISGKGGWEEAGQFGPDLEFSFWGGEEDWEFWAEFPEDLAADSAGSGGGNEVGHDAEGFEFPSSVGDCVGDGVSLCADGGSEAGVFDVASFEDLLIF